MFGRPIGKCKRLARYARPASLSARGVVYTASLGLNERSHCRSKQLRANKCHLKKLYTKYFTLNATVEYFENFYIVTS